MILSQKKTCNGCKAQPYGGHADVCQLDIQVVCVRKLGVVVEYRPINECYKPKTNNQFIECLDNRR